MTRRGHDRHAHHHRHGCLGWLFAPFRRHWDPGPPPGPDQHSDSFTHTGHVIVTWSDSQKGDAMPTQRDTPYPGAHFSVETGGARIGFLEVSQLTASVDVIEYRDGTDKSSHASKIPGLHRTGDVVLRYGTMGSAELFQWFDSVRLGKAEKRDVVIKLLDDEHEPVMTWRLRNAWPRAYRAGPLNALSSNVAIEELVLVHEGLDLV
jgi:phage tail-like protein